MMCIDILVGIINRNRIIKIFEQLKNIDEQLINEGIFIENSKLKLLILILIIIIIFCELIDNILSILAFNDPYDYKSWLSFVTGLPSMINSIEKLWFSSFLYALKQRFESMNNYLDKIVNDHTKQQELLSTLNNKNQNKNKNLLNNDKNLKKDNNDIFDINLGYLHKEINFKNSSFKIIPTDIKKNSEIIPVLPWDGKSIKLLFLVTFLLKL